MGKDDAIDGWPMVRCDLRAGFYKATNCTSEIWPLPGGSLKTLYSDAVHGMWGVDASRTPGSLHYQARTERDEAESEHISHTQTDIVGGAGPQLWIMAKNADDADIFVGLRKLDTSRNPVHFSFSNALEKGPITLGWLRASYRELDSAKSTPDRPWHPHAAKGPLVPGEPTPVEIEIWPSGTRFEASERLRLAFRDGDLYTVPAANVTRSPW